ncbi:MAG TPA: RHS repeat domain-containing protein [Kineosporiaceae bacterium]
MSPDSRYHVTRTDQIIPSTADAALAGTYTTTSTYDGLARPTSITYPAVGGLGSETVTTGYNGAFETTLSSPLGTYVASTGYTTIGQVASQVLGVSGATGSVARSFGYETATGRLLTQAAATPSTATTANVQVDGYTYTPTGDISKTTDQLAGQQQCYTYDTLDRLVAAATSASSSATGSGCTADSTGPSPYSDSYAYDADGNITSMVHNGSTTTFGYGTNTAQSVTGGIHAPTSATASGSTSTYSYDADGQLTTKVAAGVTSSYTWDPQGRLTAATIGGTTSTFAYGPDGARWVRASPTETVVYLAGQELHLAAGTSTPTVIRSYSSNGSTVAVRKTGATGAGLYWMLGDQQGSASVAVNAADGTWTRDRYLPYGGNRATTATGTTAADLGNRVWI